MGAGSSTPVNVTKQTIKWLGGFAFAALVFVVLFGIGGLMMDPNWMIHPTNQLLIAIVGYMTVFALCLALTLTLADEASHEVFRHPDLESDTSTDTPNPGAANPRQARYLEGSAGTNPLLLDLGPSIDIAGRDASGLLRQGYMRDNLWADAMDSMFLSSISGGIRISHPQTIPHVLQTLGGTDRPPRETPEQNGGTSKQTSEKSLKDSNASKEQAGGASKVSEEGDPGTLRKQADGEEDASSSKEKTSGVEEASTSEEKATGESAVVPPEEKAASDSNSKSPPKDSGMSTAGSTEDESETSPLLRAPRSRQDPSDAK